MTGLLARTSHIQARLGSCPAFPSQTEAVHHDIHGHSALLWECLHCPGEYPHHIKCDATKKYVGPIIALSPTAKAGRNRTQDQPHVLHYTDGLRSHGTSHCARQRVSRIENAFMCVFKICVVHEKKRKKTRARAKFWAARPGAGTSIHRSMLPRQWTGTAAALSHHSASAPVPFSPSWGSLKTAEPRDHHDHPSPTIPAALPSAAEHLRHHGKLRPIR